jgi:hypothetical protein
MKINKLDPNFISFASNTLGDTNKGLSGMNIAKYCSNYAIRFDRQIPFYKYPNEAPNKRTALEENLNAFEAEEQFLIIKELCDLFDANDPDVKLLKEKLYQRYGDKYVVESLSDTELVQKTKHWLSAYPASLKQYESALAKYESGVYERNALDDMRLSFELLVRDILNNNKSLENQIQEIGQYLKNAGASKELRNMIVSVINYYTDYQNNHVKHNDKVNKDELEYVIELTSVIMKYLIKS